MHQPDVAEVLDHSDPLLPGRVWLVLVALLASVGLGAWGLDDRLRDREQSAVGACAEAVRTTTTSTDRVLSAMANYLSPALYTLPAGPRRDSLYGLVAEVARDAAPEERAVRVSCEAASVVWFHPGLRERHRALLDLLEARARHLRAVGLDGQRYFSTDPTISTLRQRAFPS